MGEWDHVASIFDDFINLQGAMNDLVVQAMDSPDFQIRILLG